jgi:hypothetical protein
MACKGKGGKKGPKKRLGVLIALLFVISCVQLVPAVPMSGPSGLWSADVTTIRIDTTTTTKYGDIAPLPGGASWAVVSMSNDTTAAGFASDSINFKVGYRTLTTFPNADGKIDTIFATSAVFDTLSIARADTSSITGYAVRRTTISPAACQWIQFYVTPMAGQKTAKPQKAVLVIQRQYGSFYRVR